MRSAILAAPERVEELLQGRTRTSPTLRRRGSRHAQVARELPLLGVEYTTWPLPPGASEVLSIDFPIPSGGLGVLYDFYVEVDSDGTGEVVPHECHEGNNVSDVFSGFCEIIG